jgi:hypothetical protein
MPIPKDDSGRQHMIVFELLSALRVTLAAARVENGKGTFCGPLFSNFSGNRERITPDEARLERSALIPG